MEFGKSLVTINKAVLYIFYVSIIFKQFLIRIADKKIRIRKLIGIALVYNC
jgi:hypothetical protein